MTAESIEMVQYTIVGILESPPTRSCAGYLTTTDQKQDLECARNYTYLHPVSPALLRGQECFKYTSVLLENNLFLMFCQPHQYDIPLKVVPTSKAKTSLRKGPV